MPDTGTDKLYKCTLNFTFAPYCFSSAVVQEGNVFRLKFCCCNLHSNLFYVVYVFFLNHKLYTSPMNIRLYTSTIKMFVQSFRSI